jgi:hypothetical protein
MNDRIKELAERVVGPSRLHGGDFALMGNEQVEKFAELIVQECVDVCDAYGMPDGTSPVARIISKVIKRKFGMDE